MNKTILTMILIAAASSATAQNTLKNAPTTTTERVAALPKDAVRNPDGTYIWTDDHYKKWTYRKTNAGYVRSPLEPTQPAQGVVIPKDAVANADGSYNWTDKQGKQWVFHKTPFGVLKGEAGVPVSAPVAAPADSNSRAIDKGETVRFEHSTPFGVTGYEKKKSDLNDDERRLYEASRSKPE